ncbi:branched-chain amino acid ABC transporter permease [Desulfosporosinus sp. PR]|uniref:branched-chain amino acid ABC transporter permease n=1 Tax=Candidatus Desulfosporosinus nitrosoreducens TaxID=3401928 RepID=UPI0027E7AF06|nr:branched-chain amino acid ABC transporter permease [Desulfosporosinus sp. PR]MDQ7093312.1 branched-chain amino acid ABC transporter permease [Desulfosporosinus sp. PR]
MTRTRLLQYLVIGIVLILCPIFITSSYIMHIAVTIAIYGILVLGLELVLGQTGLFSLGHAAFYGMGAYTSALIVMSLGLPIWIGAIGAVVASGLLGALLGFPTLRLRGDYLAIATLGFGEIFRLILVNWDSLTNGPMGLPGISRPQLFGHMFDETMYFYMIVIAFFLCLAAAYRISGSFLGRAFRAIRDDEDAAEFVGINISKYKIMAFTIGGMYAGLAGSFYAHYITFISPDTFVYQDSATLLAMVFLGGAGTVVGPVLGAVALVILPEALRFLAAWRMLVVGVLMVVMMIYRPQGIIGGGIHWPWQRKETLAALEKKQ